LDGRGPLHTVWIICIYAVFWFIPRAYPWKITPQLQCRGGILSGFSRFYKYLYIKWSCFGCIGNIPRARSVIPFIFFLFQKDSIVIQSILWSSLLRFMVSSLDELFRLGISIYYSAISARAYRHHFKKGRCKRLCRVSIANRPLYNINNNNGLFFIFGDVCIIISVNLYRLTAGIHLCAI